MTAQQALLHTVTLLGCLSALSECLPADEPFSVIIGDVALHLNLASAIELAKGLSTAALAVMATDAYPPPHSSKEQTTMFTESTPGTITDNGIALTITTPYGDWHLTPQQALELNAVLSSCLCSFLTRPWSNEKPHSTIITRGMKKIAHRADLDNLEEGEDF